MAEEIRSIELVLTVDTNKRTIVIKRDLNSLGDIPFEAENMAQEASF